MEILFWKKSDTKKRFSLDFSAISIKKSDQMDMRLPQVSSVIYIVAIYLQKGLFISVILVSLCLGHTKTKENQTNTELQAFISEPQTFGQSFEVVEACFFCMNFTDDIKA